MKIVCLNPLYISETYYKNLNDGLRKLGHDFTYYLNYTNDENEIIFRIKEADIVIIENTKLPEKILKECKNLKYLDVAFTGVDHIDLDYCLNNDIKVSNASGYSTEAVAELTLGLIFDQLRKISFLDKKTKLGFSKGDNLGFELNDLTIGLIGYGKIARRVKELLKCFNVKVLVYNRSEVNDNDVEQVELSYLLKNSNIISIHLPLTKNTENLISFDEIKLLTTRPYIINTARGPIINSDALLYALENNLIKGAALDVYDYEPPLRKDEKLLTFKNVTTLPHIGYFTKEAMINRFEIVKENLLVYLDGEIKNRVI